MRDVSARAPSLHSHWYPLSFTLWDSQSNLPKVYFDSYWPLAFKHCYINLPRARVTGKPFFSNTATEKHHYSIVTLICPTRSHRVYADRDPLIPRIRHLRKPAMVVWGENDRIVPLADGVRLARETGARLMVIKDTAHMPHLQATEEVGKRVREFLQQPSGVGPS